MIEKAYKYRFYPTPEQKVALAQTFGCARYVYNWALDLRTRAYREREENLNYYDLSSALTELKRHPDTDWLCEVSSVPLQQSLRHQERAFRNFFEGRAAYPKFKPKDFRRLPVEKL
jgi:putative transposase